MHTSHIGDQICCGLASERLKGVVGCISSPQVHSHFRPEKYCSSWGLLNLFKLSSDWRHVVTLVRIDLQAHDRKLGFNWDFDTQLGP